MTDPATAAARPSALRPFAGLAAFYAALFAVLGVYMQFLPPWLVHARGVGEREVAWVLSAQTVARTFAGPIWAQRVDRSGRPRATLKVLAVGSLLAFLGFGFATSPLWLGVCAFAFGCFYPPMHAIQDALAVDTARGFGFSYGRVRVAGSIAFLIAVLAMGWWLDRADIACVHPVIVVGLAVTLVCAWFLPGGARDGRVVPELAAVAGEPQARAPIGALLRSRPFLLLLATSALIQGSHAAYYTYSTIHWRANGISDGTASQLWAEAVLAEVVLFLFARGSVERLRPTTMLMVGGLAGALRWVLIGSSTSVPLLFAINWLHALSFGATFLGAIRALERRVPPGQRASGQGLLAAASSGVGMVAGALLAGELHAGSPRAAYFAMAFLAAAGAALAFLVRRLGIPDAMAANSNAAATPE